MQITRRERGKIVELLVEGRMDVYWAEHLAKAVQEQIRHGSHHIRLNLSQVPYLSSAGIGILVRLHRELKNIHGSFAVVDCSPTALKALQITNLQNLLVATGRAADEGRADATPQDSPALAATVGRRLEANGAVYEVFSLDPAAAVQCRRIGNAGLLRQKAYRASDCRAVQFPEGSFAIGLGALGDDCGECAERFGELLVAGGAVAYLPADGTNSADFLLAGGTTLPEAQVCYGLVCVPSDTQPFRSLIRFEALNSDLPVALSSLLEACLDLAEVETAGVVMIAETAGLFGAALRRSPVEPRVGTDIFAFPQIREWLSFTAEPAHARSVALLTGIALRGERKELGTLARPLGKIANAGGGPSGLAGHLHAAAFSYRPLPKGKIDLKESVRTLFDGQTLDGILHLIYDDRDGAGARESQLVRGACWIAPIVNFAADEARG